MARKIREQSKEGLAVSLGKIAESAVKGIGGLLGLAAEMEQQGKSEYIERGEIKGKTESGKEYKGAYGFRVKVGLNPEDFSTRGACPSVRRGSPSDGRAGALGGEGRTPKQSKLATGQEKLSNGKK